MRRLLTRCALLTVMVAVLMVVPGVDAYAAAKCQVIDPLTGQCTVYVEGPGSPSSSPTPTGNSGSGGSACYWDPAKQGLSKPLAGPVPCTNQAGYWSNSYDCYIKAVSPQPPAGDPTWQGHQPGDGAVYDCYQPQTDIAIYIWAANPPPGAGAGPTPQQVAQIAIKRMDLSAIDIGIAPKPGVNSIGLVGMPVWMWAANADSHSVGPITVAASAGGLTVTATARLQSVTWDMGDGALVVCDGAGTPYVASDGQASSPDCGHVYEKSSSAEPGGKFAVSATSHWVVAWSGAGQTGTIQLGGLTRSTQIAIGEAQVLVQ